ncbi:MAG: hypothetical protein U1E35_04355 [Rhodospirillales bacterium]
MDLSEEWIEHGIARVAGHTELRAYVMRFVRPEELDELHQLHQLVASRVHHPHAFRLDSRSFMEQQIERRGRTVAVFCQGKIVAYAAISFPDDDPDNLGRDLPLPEAELAHVADYDGSAVHSDFRGNRLQQLMTHMRHRYALLHDRYHILGTVSPFNPVSLQNFLDLGCRVRNIKQKYGGMARLIIHRDLREALPSPLEPHSIVDVPLAEVEQHRSVLLQGLEGERVVWQGKEAALRYGRARPACEKASRRAAFQVKGKR